ncbi:TetR/AcrR family transcriptional regulator [Nocardia goodfellowii]
MTDARRRPRQQRSRETVDIVLEAAAQVFSREGLGATTNRIAERAGVSIGTLYQYFPDKHALLRTLAERHLREGAARMEALFADLRSSKPPFDQTICDILDAAVDLHRDRPVLHELMHRFAPRDAAELAAVRKFEDYLAEEIGYHLTRCGRGGADPALTARTLVHAVDAHLHRVLINRGIDTGQLVDLVYRLLAEPCEQQ